MQPGDEKLKRDLENLKKRLLTLPKKVGDTAVLFTKQRFREQAWVDNSTQPWKKRNPNAKRNKGRALLMNSGRLRRSIRIVGTTSDSVTIGSNVPYAAAHNEGFKGAVQVSAHSRKGKPVKAHSRNMNLPVRRFMGPSAALNKQITRLIKAEILKAIR